MSKEFMVQSQPKKITQALDKMSSSNSFIVDASSASYIYYGWAPLKRLSETSAPIWEILRVAIASDVFSAGWADGDTNGDNVWDNRASLNYL